MEKSGSMVAKAAGLGAIAGMRSMSAPVTLLELVGKGGSERLPGLLTSPAARTLSRVAAIGELVVDKLPFVPDRVKPAPLLGRALSGGVAGGLFAHSRKGSVPLGAAVGAASAVAAAFAFWKLRSLVGGKGRIAGIAAGLAEDALVMAAGRGLAATGASPGTTTEPQD